MAKNNNMNKILREGKSLNYSEFLKTCKIYKQQNGESLQKLLSQVFTRPASFEASFVESTLNIFTAEPLSADECEALIDEVKSLNNKLTFKRVIKGEEYFCLDESKSVFKSLQDFLILSRHSLGEVVDKNGNKASAEESARLAAALTAKIAKRQARKQKQKAKKALATK